MPKFKQFRAVRMWDWALASVLSLIAVAWFAPQQLSIIVFKGCLIAIATCMAFWVDHSLFKRAHDRIEGADQRDLYSSMCLLRRALIFMACVLGLALGV